MAVSGDRPQSTPGSTTRKQRSGHALWPRAPLGYRAGICVGILSMHTGLSTEKGPRCKEAAEHFRGAQEEVNKAILRWGTFSIEGSREAPEPTEGRSDLEVGGLRDV